MADAWRSASPSASTASGAHGVGGSGGGVDYQELFHRERATSQELREALREQDEQIKSMHFKMTRLAEQVQKAMASKKSGAGGRDIQVEGFIEQLNAENRAMREKIHDLENRLVATMGQKKGKAAKVMFFCFSFLFLVCSSHSSSPKCMCLWRTLNASACEGVFFSSVEDISFE